MKNKIKYVKYDKLSNIIIDLKEKQLNNLEDRIMLKLKEIENLKEIYLNYTLDDENDKYAKEKYNEYKKQYDLLKEIIEG